MVVLVTREDAALYCDLGHLENGVAVDDPTSRARLRVDKSNRNSVIQTTQIREHSQFV